MPAPADVLRVVLTWNSPVGGVFQNTFNMVLTSVATALWSEIADDVEDYLEATFADWLPNVVTGITSQSLNILLRDAVAGEWNSVLDRTYTGLAGTAVGDTSVIFSSPKLILYPGAPRHWGFRNFPPPSEGSTQNGSLLAAPLADILTSGLTLSLPYTGTYCSFTNGVYTLATETFRGFIGTVASGNALGSRTTRKQDVGI